jgi:hypothetical protein
VASGGGGCGTVACVVLDVLDRHRFRGARDDAPPASFAGLAWFSGVIACATWPRDVLAARLPDGLALAAPVEPTARHPVVFVFGEQAGPAVLRAGLALPTGAPYGEFGIFVPYAQGGDGRLCTYVWRMCSTYFPAVWEGNRRYFAKAVAKMSWRTDGTFVLASEGDRPLFSALVEGPDEWTSGRGGGPSWLGPVRDAFALPMVGRPERSGLAWSRFGWDFEAASLGPARLAAWVDGTLVDDAAALEIDVVGAVAVRDMAWRLSWPDAG